MLITDSKQLEKYAEKYRVWQGIPSIEVTKKGRIFSTFYSGGVKEQVGNFSMLLKSDDGIRFTEPIAVAYEEGNRCYDPCIWIDPLDRLWFTWTCMPKGGVYAAICEDPDAEKLVWTEPRMIGHDVMMNKPVVLSSGEWVFPIAVWNDGVHGPSLSYNGGAEEKGAFAYVTEDQGKTFSKRGGTQMPERSFDEHMILELKDGRLAMFVRTFYGIGVSYSEDRGATWSLGEDSGLGGPSSRFSVSRLKSGRILLINHVNFTGRNNLTALLSDDECRSWKHQLLLDARDNIAYPDVKEAEDGCIYVTYDRERGGFLKSMDAVYNCAREILYAKITEEDIMAGRLVNPESRLQCVISKLGQYAGPDPFAETTD